MLEILTSMLVILFEAFFIFFCLIKEGVKLLDIDRIANSLYVSLF